MFNVVLILIFIAAPLLAGGGPPNRKPKRPSLHRWNWPLTIITRG